MSQPVNLCRSKDWSELKAEKSFLGLVTVKFSVVIELEEYFEGICHNNPEIYRDILKVNGEGIVSQHYFLCRNIKAED